MYLLQTSNYHIQMTEKYLDVCMYNKILDNNLTGCYMKIIKFSLFAIFAIQRMNENNLNYYSQWLRNNVIKVGCKFLILKLKNILK